MTTIRIKKPNPFQNEGNKKGGKMGDCLTKSFSQELSH